VLLVTIDLLLHWKMEQIKTTPKSVEKMKSVIAITLDTPQDRFRDQIVAECMILGLRNRIIIHLTMLQIANSSRK